MDYPGILVLFERTHTHTHTSNGAKMLRTTATRRGALFVFEGADRSGKSTQAKRLATELRCTTARATSGAAVHLLAFPDRTTPVGRLLDAYLRGGLQTSREAAHLLFAANRWEWAEWIRSALAAGDIVVVDRYSPSGAAYSIGAGLRPEWCLQADDGLPAPDRVFLLALSAEKAASRPAFGKERYERTDFQERVTCTYSAMAAASPEQWSVLDATRSEEEVAAEVWRIALATLTELSDRPSPPAVQSLGGLVGGASVQSAPGQPATFLPQANPPPTPAVVSEMSAAAPVLTPPASSYYWRTLAYTGETEEDDDTPQRVSNVVASDAEEEEEEEEEQEAKDGQQPSTSFSSFPPWTPFSGHPLPLLTPAAAAAATSTATTEEEDRSPGTNGGSEPDCVLHQEMLSGLRQMLDLVAATTRDDTTRTQLRALCTAFLGAWIPLTAHPPA